MPARRLRAHLIALVLATLLPLVAFAAITAVAIRNAQLLASEQALRAEAFRLDTRKAFCNASCVT